MYWNSRSPVFKEFWQTRLWKFSLYGVKESPWETTVLGGTTVQPNSFSCYQFINGCALSLHMFCNDTFGNWPWLFTATNYSTYTQIRGQTYTQIRGQAHTQIRGANAYPDKGANAYPDKGANAYPDKGANAHPDKGANAYPDKGANTHPDKGANTHPDKGTSTHSFRTKMNGLTYNQNDPLNVSATSQCNYQQAWI